MWVERFCTRYARRHVCVSRDVAEFSRVRTGLDATKLEVIANGVDVERFSGADPIELSGRGIAEGAPVLAWIGRLESQKDPVAAIEAIGLLDSTHRECHLVLAGEGPLRGRIEARVAELGLANRVHLLGRVSQIPALLARSCGLILTSRWEGMPNAALEALACGTPVIAMRAAGGIAELAARSDAVTVAADTEAFEAAMAAVTPAPATEPRPSRLPAEYEAATVVAEFEKIIGGL